MIIDDVGTGGVKADDDRAATGSTTGERPASIAHAFDKLLLLLIPFFVCVSRAAFDGLRVASDVLMALSRRCDGDNGEDVLINDDDVEIGNVEVGLTVILDAFDVL